jgi:hypothetical protein
MNSTERTIILIKAQALDEASKDWQARSDEYKADGNAKVAEVYLFMALVAQGRARSLEFSTYAE